MMVSFSIFRGQYLGEFLCRLVYTYTGNSPISPTGSRVETKGKQYKELFTDEKTNQVSKSSKKCSVCKQMNRYQADSDKHQAGSSKCPFYKKDT